MNTSKTDHYTKWLTVVHEITPLYTVRKLLGRSPYWQRSTRPAGNTGKHTVLNSRVIRMECVFKVAKKTMDMTLSIICDPLPSQNGSS